MRGVTVPPSKLIVTNVCPRKGGFFIRGVIIKGRRLLLLLLLVLPLPLLLLLLLWLLGCTGHAGDVPSMDLDS